MGKHFGELYKIRGIVSYSISPFEQRAFAGVFKKGFPNMIRRFREEVLYFGPPFVFGYLVYDQVTKAHAETLRKNPKDFENDV